MSLGTVLSQPSVQIPFARLPRRLAAQENRPSYPRCGPFLLPRIKDAVLLPACFPSLLDHVATRSAEKAAEAALVPRWELTAG
jgi:hypothetical protein